MIRLLRTMSLFMVLALQEHRGSDESGLFMVLEEFNDHVEVIEMTLHGWKGAHEELDRRLSLRCWLTRRGSII